MFDGALNGNTDAWGSILGTGGTPWADPGTVPTSVGPDLTGSLGSDPWTTLWGDIFSGGGGVSVTDVGAGLGSLGGDFSTFFSDLSSLF